MASFVTTVELTKEDFKAKVWTLLLGELGKAGRSSLNKSKNETFLYTSHHTLETILEMLQEQGVHSNKHELLDTLTMLVLEDRVFCVPSPSSNLKDDKVSIMFFAIQPANPLG